MEFLRGKFLHKISDGVDDLIIKTFSYFSALVFAF